MPHGEPPSGHFSLPAQTTRARAGGNKKQPTHLRLGSYHTIHNNNITFLQTPPLRRLPPPSIPISRSMASPPPGIDLPPEVLAVLPSDPFEQLDVARKITSIALATRVAALEDEVSALRDALADRDDHAAELRAHILELEASLSDLSHRLARVTEEKESLVGENAALSGTVKKLNKDVSKLEVFRKALMQSLQEEEEGIKRGAHSLLNKPSTYPTFSAGPVPGDEDVTVPKLPSIRARLTDSESVTSDDVSYTDADVTKPGVAYILTPQNITPRFTPPDSPTKFSASVSPRLSPRRQSISLAKYPPDEKASVSAQASRNNSVSAPSESGSQPGRSRIDGKEFFRQARNRLSYEQFSAFLANVKELNASRQTREEALRKADEIFGPSNKDLYAIFEGLIARKT